jgi:ATP-dependent Zn protease
MLTSQQGDQIGRFFAPWTIVYILWAFFFLKITEGAQTFGVGTFSQSKINAFMLTKKIGWVAFFHKLIWSPCLSVI